MTANPEQYWSRQARRYDRVMLVLGRPMPEVARLSADAVHGQARVLEVGAGTGLVTSALAGAVQQVVASDYADGMVAALQQRMRAAGHGNVQCVQADVYQLPYPDASFDAVVAANVLHLLPDLPAGLEALRRVVRPGGVVVVPTYCHAQTRLARAVSALMALAGFPGQRRFDLASLQQAVEAAGMTVTQATLLPGLLPIGFVVGRVG